ncbi:hypothetical protein [Arthrobacter sp. SLBN-112]|nr:hypothetical protein [Arthrobacter sp. SLBN-112]MDQ0800179.1 hypothetical protein [Arthrobacter sp. SLBN-112]
MKNSTLVKGTAAPRTFVAGDLNVVKSVNGVWKWAFQAPDSP